MAQRLRLIFVWSLRLLIRFRPVFSGEAVSECLIMAYCATILCEPPTRRAFATDISSHLEHKNASVDAYDQSEEYACTEALEVLEGISKLTVLMCRDHGTRTTG